MTAEKVPYMEDDPIIMGPSKYDFMVAVFSRKRVNFTVKNVMCKCSINNLKSCDGSGSIWEIEGEFWHVSNICASYNYSFKYNCRTRKGSVLSFSVIKSIKEAFS